MPITLKILKRSAGGATLYATRDLEVLPASIGRDPGCTVPLEDPHKHLSRFHVEIEEQGGAYWMSVVSKVNPVTVKGQRHGPGARLALRSGDAFELSDYEVQVLLSDPVPAPPPMRVAPAADAMQALQAETAPGPDEAERLFNESTFFGADQMPPPLAEPSEEERLFNESTFMGVGPRAAEALKREMPPEASSPTVSPTLPQLSLDPRLHQLALTAGLRAVAAGVLRRFDPQAQARLAPAGEEEFRRAIERDFMAAYQAALERLKGGR
jgi:predicted component of type VI protein secretion system